MIAYSITGKKLGGTVQNAAGINCTINGISVFLLLFEKFLHIGGIVPPFLWRCIMRPHDTSG
jgi:hypothetical protein